MMMMMMEEKDEKRTYIDHVHSMRDASTMRTKFMPCV